MRRQPHIPTRSCPNPRDHHRASSTPRIDTHAWSLRAPPAWSLPPSRSSSSSSSRSCSRTLSRRAHVYPTPTTTTTTTTTTTRRVRQSPTTRRRLSSRSTRACPKLPARWTRLSRCTSAHGSSPTTWTNPSVWSRSRTICTACSVPTPARTRKILLVRLC